MIEAIRAQNVTLALKLGKNLYLTSFFIIFTKHCDTHRILMQQFTHDIPPLFIDNQLAQVKERRFVVLYPVHPSAGVGLDDDMALLFQ